MKSFVSNIPLITMGLLLVVFLSPDPYNWIAIGAQGILLTFQVGYYFGGRDEFKKFDDYYS